MIEGNGKMSLRRSKLSTIKGSSAPRRRRREIFLLMMFNDKSKAKAATSLW